MRALNLKHIYIRLGLTCLLLGCQFSHVWAQAEKPPRLSNARIAKLTQDGDRLADQGDYQAALDKYTRAYQGVVSRVRGQDFKQSVKPSIFTRKQLGEEMLKLLKEEYTDEELSLMDNSYKVFGLVPPELDSAKLMTNMLTEEVAGFYDPDNKRMVLIVEEPQQADPGWLGRLFGATPAFDKDEQKTTLAHELTHALQDQLYDLNAMEAKIEDDDDMLLAFSALVEGDATLLMFAEAGGEDIKEMDADGMRATFNIMSWMMPMAGGKTYRSAPPIFRDSLTFPYFQGMLFTLSLAGGTGWENIHAAYQQPPLSTEQILHPAKYNRDPDIPQSVEIPPIQQLLDESWNHQGGNCLGELQIGILLKTVFGGRVASEGWDGDRYEVFKSSDGKLAVVHVSVWDSERDANEFAKAYRSYRNPPQEKSPQGPPPSSEQPNAGQGSAEPLNAEQVARSVPANGSEQANAVFAAGAERKVQVHGDRVWIVEGFDTKQTGSIIAELPKCKFVEKTIAPD